MELDSPARPRLAIEHMLAWGQLGVTADAVLWEHVDVQSSLHDLLEWLFDPNPHIKAPTNAQLFELTRFLGELEARWARWFIRSIEIDLRLRGREPRAVALYDALLGLRLMLHADVPLYRRAA
jgi:hypothetical protein